MTATRRDGEGLAGYSPPLLRPRRRLRWTGFVAFNLIAFAAANVFWQYLRTGQWCAITTKSLHTSLVSSLGQILLEPLGIFTHPWMIIVLGLLLAVLIVVPLAMAVMYPLLLSMVFVVTVAVVGHSPMLALALAAGCLLSARTRLRRSYPFYAILLGMLPVGVYLYLLTYAGIDASLLLPIQRWVLAIPFLIAMLAVIPAAGVVVLLARWTKFQPGVVWPALLILLFSAGAVFWTKAGPDELQYALLARLPGGSEAIFCSTPRDKWQSLHAPGLAEQMLPQRIGSDLEQRKDKLCRRCNTFLENYPTSPRAASVAWIVAQCQSLQPNVHALRNNLVSYSAAFPAAASAGAWNRIIKDYPDSDQAALALWRLGELELRKIAGMKPAEIPAQADKADLMLRRAAVKLDEVVLALGRRFNESTRGEIFEPLAPLPAKFDYVAAQSQVRNLLWQIEQNNVLKDSRCAVAMARLLDNNPYAPGYAYTLKALAADQAYRNTKMAGNLRLAVAKLKTDLHDRANAMKAIADDERTDPDAAVEAYYELGRISMQTASAPTIRFQLKEPEYYFKIVIAAPPNPWQSRAAKWLTRNPPGNSSSRPN
ncbi:MAG: hypothetical protein K8S55_00835 [Phycisphaerae bacterium]|nr:hypothetical protein [Phycisphaerae bacterium]